MRIYFIGDNFNWKPTKIIAYNPFYELDKQNYDVSIGNLRALCQRCHLRYDAKNHAENRKKNLAEKKVYKICLIKIIGNKNGRKERQKYNGLFPALLRSRENKIYT